MNRRRFLFSLVPLGAVPLALGGCGLFGDDPTTLTVRARVVHAETGEPLAGIGAGLRMTTSNIGLVTVATSVTDADGRVALRADVPPGAISLGVHSFYFDVNDNPYHLDGHTEPYDERYATIRTLLPKDDAHDLGTIELGPPAEQ